MIRKIFIILFVFSSVQVMNAQDTKVVQDPRVDSLINLHQKAQQINLDHQEHDGIYGYRIQIYFESGNNSKNRAIWYKDQFDSRYPDVSSYIVFTEPYYRVRVGDFRTQLEAENFLRQIRRRYQNAFVTQDKIKFPKLLSE